MKKIKLIAPILGVTTLATSLVPLTSCNKGNNGISKADWNKAFAEIKDPYNTNRNFTVEGYLYKVDESGKEVIDEEWTCKSAGKFNEGVQKDNTREDHYDSCLVDDIIWIRDATRVISPYLNIVSRGGVMIACFELFGELFDSMYDYKTNKGDNKYEAIWLNQSNLIGTCEFEFDNLRVKTVEAKLFYTEANQEQQLLGAKLAFSQYGTTTTTLKDTDFPVANRVKKAKLATTGDKFVIDSFTPPGTHSEDLMCVFKFEMPSDLAITGLNTINIGNNTMDEYYLLLNDQVLIEDEDYTFEDDNKFKLKNPLSKNDKLWLAGTLVSDDPTTLELVKE